MSGAAYRPLDGCDARIIGSHGAALITVNAGGSRRRQRFSIAHELGHWCHHRGKVLVCRAEEYRPRDWSSPERIADGYAADLLMPRYLFDAAARQQPKLNFKVVNDLADLFDTSLTATAIRLVESDQFPALLVCHSRTGREWFARAPCVSERWVPRETLDAEGFAFGVLYGGKVADPIPRKIGADAWFDRWGAEGFEIHEQTMRVTNNEVLTLVHITDPHMLDEDGLRSHGRRW